MTRRRRAREWVVQFLFQNDFNPGNLEQALEEFWRYVVPDEKSRQFAEELIRGVMERRPEIDRRLQSYAEHWEMSSGWRCLKCFTVRIFLRWFPSMRRST